MHADLQRFTDRVVRLAGASWSSKTVEAVDDETQQKVLVKIMRAVDKYRHDGETEIRILQKLKAEDPLNKQSVSPSFCGRSLVVDR